LRKENESLKNELAQKDVRIRQLELQLEALSSMFILLLLFMIALKLVINLIAGK
jgi:hypothetical protein